MINVMIKSKQGLGIWRTLVGRGEGIVTAPLEDSGQESGSGEGMSQSDVLRDEHWRQTEESEQMPDSTMLATFEEERGAQRLELSEDGRTWGCRQDRSLVLLKLVDFNQI